jgi:hypothetical protein
MREAKDHLTRWITELKCQYPNDIGYIESELQDYLHEEGPPADDEFYDLLKGRLETDYPKPLKKGRARKGRAGSGRPNRR